MEQLWLRCKLKLRNEECSKYEKGKGAKSQITRKKKRERERLGNKVSKSQLYCELRGEPLTEYKRIMSASMIKRLQVNRIIIYAGLKRYDCKYPTWRK